MSIRMQLLAISLLLGAALAACSDQSSSNSELSAPVAADVYSNQSLKDEVSAYTESIAEKVGDDTDVYGCIGSAGYQWCASTASCERPWELSEQENFENTAAAFSAYCETEAVMTDQLKPVGADRDEHGCIASAGYQWCAKLEQCVRPWELAAEQGFENTAEAFEAFCQTKNS